MKANKTLFYCTECGNEFPKWSGKCTACGAWNTVVERPAEEKRRSGGRKSSAGVAAFSMGRKGLAVRFARRGAFFLAFAAKFVII